jgi:holo-[acyl-carrier protein] synthase
VTSVRVGTDLALIAQTQASLAEFGERYLHRIFTPGERADCAARDAGELASLTARFAAKEALLKALAPEPSATPPWTSMEVVVAPSGAPSLVLHAESAALAQARGVVSLAVSLTHEAEYASAVVVALCEEPG